MDRSPRSRALFTLEAQQLLAEGRFAQVVEICKRGLSYFPENPAGYVIMAQAYIRLGEHDRALNVLRDGFRRTGSARLQELYTSLAGAGAGRTIPATHSPLPAVDEAAERATPSHTPDLLDIDTDAEQADAIAEPDTVAAPEAVDEPEPLAEIEELERWKEPDAVEETDGTVEAEIGEVMEEAKTSPAEEYFWEEYEEELGEESAEPAVTASVEAVHEAATEQMPESIEDHLPEQESIAEPVDGLAHDVDDAPATVHEDDAAIEEDIHEIIAEPGSVAEHVPGAEHEEIAGQKPVIAQIETETESVIESEAVAEPESAIESEAVAEPEPHIEEVAETTFPEESIIDELAGEAGSVGDGNLAGDEKSDDEEWTWKPEESIFMPTEGTRQKEEIEATESTTAEEPEPAAIEEAPIADAPVAAAPMEERKEEKKNETERSGEQTATVLRMVTARPAIESDQHHAHDAGAERAARPLALHIGKGIARLRSSNLRLIPGLEFAPLRHEDQLRQQSIAPLMNEPMPQPERPRRRTKPAEAGALPPLPSLTEGIQERRSISLERPKATSPLIPVIQFARMQEKDRGEGEATALDELARQLEHARIPAVQETEPHDTFEHSIVSETLANILVAQGAYGEALKAFQTLARVHPERRTKYEETIEELRRRIEETDEQ